MEVVVAGVPEDGVVEAGGGEPRRVEVVDPAQVLVLHRHVGGDLVQRRVLLAPLRDGGVDALGHGMAEGADVAQHLVVDAGQPGVGVTADRRDVLQHALDGRLEAGVVVVAELGEHRAAAGRRVRQHALHLGLAGLLRQRV